MDTTFISLLYPSEAARRAAEAQSVPVMDDDACRELGLSRMMGLKNSSLSAYFTCDPEVILFRQQMFSDLNRLPELEQTLSALLPVLCDITALRRIRAGHICTASPKLSCMSR